MLGLTRGGEEGLTRGGFLGKEPARGEVSSLRFSQSHRHMSGKIGVRKRGARCHPFASLRAGVFARALDLRSAQREILRCAQDDSSGGIVPCGRPPKAAFTLLQAT